MRIEERNGEKILHLTSEDSKEVAEKIERVSRRIFEKYREAYRILANKDSTAIEWSD